MALLDGKQIRNSSTSLSKLSGVGIVNFTTGGTMSFDAGSVLRTDDTNILIGTDVVNKNYVDSFVTGLHIKESVEAISTTASLVLSGDGQLVDGWTLSTGDRVLLNAQAGVGVPTASNGIYVVATGSWTRALDADGNPTNEVEKGDFTFVKHGDLYAGTGWVLSTSNAVDPDNILVGTESQLWTQFSESTDIQAGDGLIQVGQDFQVNTGTGLTISSDQVIIANTGVTAATYGDANSVATFTVNAQGQLTFADNVDINITSSQVSDFTSSSETAIFTDANFVDGITVTFSVTAGSSVTAEVTPGSLTASRLNIINPASASQGWKLGYNTSGQFEWLNPTLSDISAVVAGAGLTGGGESGSVTLSVNTDNGLSIDGDNVILGGTLSQNTTINANNYDFIVTGADIIFFTSSVFDVEANGFISLDAGTGSVQIFADDAITLSASSSVDLLSNGDLVFSFAQSTVTDNSGNGLGLVYTSDYSGTFATNSLVSKKYVDDAIVVSSNPYYAGDGLDLSGQTFSLDPNSAGNGLTYSAGVYNVNLGANSGLTFSGDDIIIEVDGTTIQIVNGVLQGAAQGLIGITAGNGLSGGGTGSYVTLDVNLGANSGLTFSGDDIVIESTIGGSGLSFTSGVLDVNLGANSGLTFSGDDIVIESTIGGAGLSFTSGVLDVNLGANSGLTFSGDDIIIDTNIAGNGLDFTSGVLTVNTSEITPSLAGSGLTSNGGALDVEVNTDSIEIDGNNQLRLKNTITGSRTFTDTVTIQGDLIVEGTQSIINTENIYIEDNIITLNATYSGPYNVVDAGIEVNLGGGTFAALIWDSSESLWAVGFSGSTSTIITEAGTGLTKSGNTLSINTTGFATTLAGAGLTSSAGEINVGAGTGIIVNADDVTLDYELISGAGLTSSAGVINIGSGTGIIVNADDVAIDFGSVTGFGLTQNGSQISIDFTSISTSLAGDGLSANGGTLSVNVGNGLEIISDTVQLGGTLSQTTTINGSSNSLTINTVSSFEINTGTSGNTALLNLNGSQAILRSDVGNGTFSQMNVQDDYAVILSNNGLVSNKIEVFSSPQVLLDNTEGYLIVTDDIASKGLVYGGDYTANFSTQSLITKGYVDAQTVFAGNGLTANGSSFDVVVGTGVTISNGSVSIDFVSITGTGLTQNGSQISLDSTVAGDGLSYNTGVINVNTGQGLTISSDNVEMIWGGTSSGLTFSNNAISVNVDNSTLSINSSGQLTVIGGSAQPEYSQRNLTPLTTTPNANNEPTGLTLSFTPSDYSRVSVYVNGQLQFLGNGTASGVDCYFTGDSGSTARLITSLVVGDELYWNGNSANAGFRLDTTDKIDFIYEK